MGDLLDIFEIDPNDDRLNVVLEVMAHLRSRRTIAELRRLYVEGHRGSGYRLVALFDGDSCCAVAGYRFGTNFALGKYLYVEDLVTRDGQRSKGHGSELLTHIKGIAAAADCESLALDSRTERLDAHRFYDREGLRRDGFHFVLSVD